MWSSGVPLRARDFSAEMDGSALRVLGVEGPGDDLMLLVVLDLTCDLSLVEPAREALVDGTRGLPPRTTAGLLRAQDGLKVLVDPTSDREAFVRALQDLPINGKPGLLDTLETAEHSTAAARRKARRPAVSTSRASRT